jgi:hypothetical protein
MFTFMDKALVAGFLPVALAILNHFTGLEVGPEDPVVVTIWGLIQGAFVYFWPNKGTVYTGAK